MSETLRRLKWLVNRVLCEVMVLPKTTVSLIKCDVGSLAGHHVVPKPLFSIAEKNLAAASKDGLINNFLVFNAGDDLELLMVHGKGEQSPDIHKLAWDIFRAAADRASELKLYGAGQDILKTALTRGIVSWS